MKFAFASIVVISTLITQTAAARLVNDIHPAACNALTFKDGAGGHAVEALCQLSNTTLTQLIRLAHSSQQSDKHALQQQITRLFHVRSKSETDFVTHLLVTIYKLDIPLYRIRERFIELTTRHPGLANRLLEAPVSRTDVQALRQQAGADLLTTPKKLPSARSLLTSALALTCGPDDGNRAAFCFADPVAAQLYRDLAWLEEGALNFSSAAQFYEDAAATVPSNRRDERLYDLSRAAQLWSEYGELHELNDGLVESARLYEQILALTSKDMQRQDRARINTNFGSVLQKLGDRDSDIGILQQSASTLRTGLQLLSENDDKTVQAVTRSKLATTLQLMGKHGSNVEYYRQAIQEFARALGDIKREELPDQWAAINNNLGTTRWLLGHHDANPQLMHDAASAFRNALTVWNHRDSPQNWIIAQGNLANTLREIGSRSSDSNFLNESIHTYRLVIQGLQQARQPLIWGTTQYDLAIALWTLGMAENKPSLLEEAADTFHFALEELDKEDTPLRWASAQHGLGLADFSVAVRRRDGEKMSGAIRALQSALQVRRGEQLLSERAMTLDVLGRAQWFLGSENADVLALKLALEAFKEARDIRISDQKRDHYQSYYSHSIESIETMISDLKDNP